MTNTNGTRAQRRAGTLEEPNEPAPLHDEQGVNRFDALLTPGAPAGSAWLARTHREIQQRCAGQYVFTLRYSLGGLVEWLEAAGIALDESLFPVVEFDDDRDAADVNYSGGWLVFTWEEVRYEVFSVTVPSWRRDEQRTWVVTKDRAAAERLVDTVWRHHRRQQSRVMVFSEGDFEEAPRLEKDLRDYTWDSVVLPSSMRERLQRAATLFFQSRHVYEELGIPWKLGFLFVGPPGTGKTLTTKVLAATCDVPFLYIRGLSDERPDASDVRQMFRAARDRAPCLLCLEDVDSLVTEDLRSTFLNELDGLEEDYRGVLTVATTNHPEKLDAALLHRPSRFDYRFEFPLPDEASRRAFVLHWLQRLQRAGYVEAPETAVQAIVRRSRGMSQAYLKRVLVGTVLRMHHEEARGDAAFTRLAREELADALEDRTAARRLESGVSDMPSGSRVGFRME